MTPEQLSWIGIVLAAGAIGLPIYQFVKLRRDELIERATARYHQIIKNIYEAPRNEAGGITVDLWLAQIYELRYYWRYYPVTIRLLNRLIEKRTELVAKSEHYNLMLDEAELTRSFIKSKWLRTKWTFGVLIGWYAFSIQSSKALKHK